MSPSVPAWWTTEEVAEHFRLPVKSIRARIRLGRERPDHPQAIRAKNLGTERRPMYRISAAEIRRLDQLP